MTTAEWVLFASNAAMGGVALYWWREAQVSSATGRFLLAVLKSAHLWCGACDVQLQVTDLLPHRQAHARFGPGALPAEDRGDWGTR